MPSLSRILLVDDEEDLLFLLQARLRREGYQVDICLNGEGMIEKVKTDPPDLILLDIKMQEVDGGELCQFIKSDPVIQYIKVVLFSANHDIEEIAANRLADGWLSKPYHKEKAGELFARLFSGL